MPTKKKGRKTSRVKELTERVKELKAKLEDKDKEAEEIFSKLQYAVAELENYRKRVEKERLTFVQYANQQLVKKILPVLDDFERALESMREKDQKEYEGISMVYQNLMSALESEGLKEIPAIGEMFDPYKHEAVHLVNDGTRDLNTIVEVVQKGYTLNSKVIRPSRVVVVRRDEEE